MASRYVSQWRDPLICRRRGVLLVEGQDDEHVARHIWWRHAEDAPFCIKVMGSEAELRRVIFAEVKAEGRLALGILLDANTDPGARWQSVRDRLAQAGIAAPERLSPDGTIIEGRPRVGVWLMPDNAASGELEDFVAQMIPDCDPVWPLSQDYIEGIPCAERKFRKKKKARAQVHAWLAAREDPRRMGEAIRTRDLEVDGALCQEFVAWLKALFT